MAKKYGELINYEIIFEGVLKKCPTQKSKVFFNFITKRWTKRHFVLYKTLRPNQVYLVYFKVEPSPECKSIGSINLVKLTNLSVDVGSNFHRSNVFSIQTSDDKCDNIVYFLCAQTFDLMNTWVDKIVTSLNLNNHNSRFNSLTTLSSPVSHSSTRGIPRFNQNYSSNPRLTSALLSNQAAPETSRFSFSNLNGASSDNATSSYYNLSPSKGSFSQEHLQDPMSTEGEEDEEDTYKYPCENHNSHLYVNLEDEEKTPTPTETKMSDDPFFGNNDNPFNSVPITKTATLQKCNVPSDDAVFEDKNLTANLCDSVLQHETEETKSEDVDICDFDFPLPTRVRNTSTSSSSSSYSLSSNDGPSSNRITLPQDTVVPPVPISDRSPPLVPKRLNLLDVNKKNIPTETVLPLKTPKSFAQKNGSTVMETGVNEESFGILNYMDATNLILDNNKLDQFRDSTTYSSLNLGSAYYTNSQMSQYSSDFKGADISLDRCDTPSLGNIEDCTATSVNTLASIVKENVPLVEYREISEARTEALLKLNVRIVNN